ncbi:unnamed protein product [Tilletia laevis]|uniref:Uncharacterized protein n=1 Tax=Tilletia laevis TaxID=157183 RepID=A0A9N8QD87_9BASI|nr:hypothetical protein CF336_g7441 [Tilletia laevis]CAD6929834.1 unnamed protein product [Tilletia laevis]
MTDTAAAAAAAAAAIESASTLVENEVDRLHAPATVYLTKLAHFPYSDQTHTPALQHIADTDTWPPHGPAWDDDLRIAIQHRLLSAFRAYPAPHEVQPELHRAAPLIPLLLQRHQQQIQHAHQQQLAAQIANNAGPAAAAAAAAGRSGLIGPPPPHMGPSPAGGTDAGPVPVAAAGAGAGTEGAPPSAGPPNSGSTEAGLGLDPGAADTSTSSAVEAAQSALASRFVSASTLDAAASALNISPADLSSFYPSKRHLHHFHLVQQQQHLQLQQQQQQQEQQQRQQSAVQASQESSPTPINAPTGPPSAVVPSQVFAEPSSETPNHTAGPSSSALHNNNSSARPLGTGPPLYAPQIPIKQAEVMLYQLFSTSFSLEPARTKQEEQEGGKKGGTGASRETDDAKMEDVGKDEKVTAGVGEAVSEAEEVKGKAEAKAEAEKTAGPSSATSGPSAPVKEDEQMDTDPGPARPTSGSEATSTTTTTAPAEPSAVGPRPSDLPPTHSSTSISTLGFDFTTNTSPLPILDASTPLFVHSPPFTIQRLAELALEPRRHHASLTKFMYALERVLRVTARWDAVRQTVAASAVSAVDGEKVEEEVEAPPSSSIPAAPLPAMEGVATVLPVNANAVADATQTMANVSPAIVPASASATNSNSGSVATPTATAERTIKRMRSERSLKKR